MNIVWPLLGGVSIIALLLAAMALALYLIWWFVMLIVSFIPMVGKRGRHANRERLNRGG